MLRERVLGAVLVSPGKPSSPLLGETFLHYSAQSGATIPRKALSARTVLFFQAEQLARPGWKPLGGDGGHTRVLSGVGAGAGAGAAAGAGAGAGARAGAGANRRYTQPARSDRGELQPKQKPAAMALVALDDSSSAPPPEPAAWRTWSVGSECRPRRARWLAPTPSGRHVLALCGGQHCRPGDDGGVHFLTVDAGGGVASAELRHDGVDWRTPIRSDSIVDLATVSSTESEEAVLLAGEDGTLHLLGLAVCETGGEALQQALQDLLLRHADAAGDPDWGELQSEPTRALLQRAAAAGLDVEAVAAATRGQIATTVRANSRQDYRPLATGRDTVAAVATLGNSCAVGCDGGSLALLDLQRPDASPLLSKRESFCINGVAVLGGGAPLLASVCTGGLLKLWDSRSQSSPLLQMAPPPQETTALTCVVARPGTDGLHLMTGSSRGVVALWDRRAPAHPVSVFRPHEEHVWEIAFDSSATESFFTASNDGTVAEHVISAARDGDNPDLHWRHRLVETTVAVNCCCAEPGSGVVAAGTEDGTVHFSRRGD